MFNLYIIAPDTHIIACLENSQATQSLQLSDLALPAVQLAPLFRALNRQHTLQELHLAGNCLGDDGVKVWAQELNMAFGKSGGELANVSLCPWFSQHLNWPRNSVLLLMNVKVSFCVNKNAPLETTQNQLNPPICIP
jgi:hypothetical protein